MDITPKAPTTPEVKSAPSADTAVSSPAVGEQSLGDFVKTNLNPPVQAEKDSSAETESTEQEVVESNEADDSADSTIETLEDDSSPEPPAETPVDETKPVPYARFKEVNDKFREFEQKYQESEKTLSDPDVRAALDVLNLIRTDPSKALEQLVPLVDQLKQIKGESFPPDIAAMLEEGTITKQVAQELTQLRHRANATGRALETEKATREQQFRSAIMQTWATWDQEHRKVDPDFQPGSKKWDLVNKLLDAEVRQRGFPSDQSAAIKMVEAIYSDVNTLVSSGAPKKVVRKVLTSTSTSAGHSELDPAKMDLKAFVKAKLKN